MKHLFAGMILIAALLVSVATPAPHITQTAGVEQPTLLKGNLPNFYDCPEGEDLVTLTPALTFFTPPENVCQLTIRNGGKSQKRVMKLNFDLPPELVTGERISFGYDQTGWRCPVKGTIWSGTYYTKNWKFTVTTGGTLKGTCTCTVDFNDPHVCKES